jgi:hypothetical protein
MTDSIVVLTKDPSKGQVKTRLAVDIGNDAAVALHEAMVWETLERIRPCGLPVRVSLQGQMDGAFANQIRCSGFEVEAQIDGDLGTKLAHAMRPPGKHFAMGTDCVVFNPEWIVSAIAATDPVVMGPTQDGGYWLVGADLSAPNLAETLFKDMVWSVPTVASTTLRRLQHASCSVHLLPECYDIDTLSDLHRLVSDRRCVGRIRAVLNGISGLNRP